MLSKLQPFFHLIPFLGLLNTPAPKGRPHLTRLLEQLIVAVTAALTMYATMSHQHVADTAALRAATEATHAELARRNELLQQLARYLERQERKMDIFAPPKGKNLPPE